MTQSLAHNLFQGLKPTGSNGAMIGCDATRVIAAGGALQSLLLPTDITPYEGQWRRGPQEGVFSATPQRVFTFEIGAITVPPRMILAIAEFQFKIYRYHGIAAGEVVELPRGMCSSSVGVDLNIAQARKGNIQYELIPVLPEVQQMAFNPVVTGGTIAGVGALLPQPVPVGGSIPNVYSTTSAVNAAGAQNAFVLAAGAGQALMPLSDRENQGPKRMPFTYYARENQAVQLRCCVYQGLNFPVAYFEARLSGYFVPAPVLDALLEKAKPCSNNGNGV